MWQGMGVEFLCKGSFYFYFRDSTSWVSAIQFSVLHSIKTLWRSPLNRRYWYDLHIWSTGLLRCNILLCSRQPHFPALLSWTLSPSVCTLVYSEVTGANPTRLGRQRYFLPGCAASSPAHAALGQRARLSGWAFPPSIPPRRRFAKGAARGNTAFCEIYFMRRAASPGQGAKKRCISGDPAVPLLANLFDHVWLAACMSAGWTGS